MSDVFGDAILSYLQGNKNAEIEVWIDSIEDDAIPVSTFFRSYDEMPEAEQIALQECKGKILDVGAAAGCHSLWLQQHNKNVTAIDISAGACKAMAERGVKNVQQVNVFDLSPDVKYDTILLLMNGMGMGGDLDGTSHLMEFLQTILAPNGQIITDSSDIIYMYEEEDGSSTIPMHQYYGEIKFDIAFKNGRDISKESFPWVYLDPNILEMIAFNKGMEMEVIHFGEHFDYLARITKKA